ncbi:hypothetical protein BD779DRAFT_265644 [Infundibulicybe gibba]|nr:hypothetical protein BD779DRAFT_265644 [Infundibulicybe gibba]
MSTTDLLPQNAVASAGPLIIGYLLNWGLYGVLSVQVYMYYLGFPRDRAVAKCLVFGLYAVETLQTALVTHDAFMTFGVDYGDVTALDNVLLAGISIPILSGIVSCTVQIFFAYRIFILSRSKLLPSVICIIALTQGSAGLAQGVQATKTGHWSELQTDAFISCTVWLTGAAVCDIIIAISMSYCLSRSETGFRSTQILISKLIRLTIETGCMTAATATADIALFLAFPHSTYHTTPALILAKAYSNTLLVTFNNRLRIVNGGADTSSIGLDSPLPRWVGEKAHGKTFRHQKNQDQPRGQNGTRPIEVIVNVQYSNWSTSNLLNESDTRTNQLEGIDDAIDQKRISLAWREPRRPENLVAHSRILEYNSPQYKYCNCP